MMIFLQLCYALTILLSAFLLFQIQPLISKFILPWFGGSPSVWTTAMLFFQCALCAGYFYAFVLSRRVSAKRQAVVHLVLLALAAVAASFIIPDASLKPAGDEDPVFKILALLGLSVGLPYFFLATTGPLLQDWYARANPGGSAFRLYALSNAGSLFALLSFPYLFEPYFTIQDIGRMWTLGFWVFTVLCAASVLFNARLAQPQAAPRLEEAEVTDGHGAPSWWTRAQWVALPALASLAFIATTDHVSHDIAPEPRLWITTLGLYLLTFIICFDHPRWYLRRLAAPLTVAAVVLLSGREQLPAWLGLELAYSLSEMRWAHFVVMFLVCFVCHGELYRARPANPRYLTEYYLLMSVGGACGGLFVSLVATNFFNDYHEWSLMLLAVLALGASIVWREWPQAMVQRIVLPVACGLAALVLFWEDPLFLRSGHTDEYSSTVLYQSRNFYGTVSVTDRVYAKDPERNRRTFYSGQVVHGMQLTHPDKRRANVTYFSEGGGSGQTFVYAASVKPSLEVAIVGLGAGTLANYARSTDSYDFYEINPQAIDVARRYFDNLSECKARSQQMFLGDARLKFEALPANKRYDVIALDAFTGDSVPLHLLTKEAFALYEKHLADDGLIVVNITNSYLDLYPVVRRQAQELGMKFRHTAQAADPSRGIYSNRYLVMGRNTAYFEKFADTTAQPVKSRSSVGVEDAPLWTDSFSSIGPIQLKD